jgi:hypothetical protein
MSIADRGFSTIQVRLIGDLLIDAFCYRGGKHTRKAKNRGERHTVFNFSTHFLVLKINKRKEQRAKR